MIKLLGLLVLGCGFTLPSLAQTSFPVSKNTCQYTFVVNQGSPSALKISWKDGTNSACFAGIKDTEIVYLKKQGTLLKSKLAACNTINWQINTQHASLTDEYRNPTGIASACNLLQEFTEGLSATNHREKLGKLMEHLTTSNNQDWFVDFTGLSKKIVLDVNYVESRPVESLVPLTLLYGAVYETDARKAAKLWIRATLMGNRDMLQWGSDDGIAELLTVWHFPDFPKLYYQKHSEKAKKTNLIQEISKNNYVLFEEVLKEIQQHPATYDSRWVQDFGAIKRKLSLKQQGQFEPVQPNMPAEQAFKKAVINTAKYFGALGLAKEWETK